jgi:hypothetical protein
MAKWVLIALAAAAAAVPAGAQPGPDPDYYGPPPAGMGPPPPGMHGTEGPPPPPGVSWRERGYDAPRSVRTQGGAEIRTRTWMAPGAPPSPPMGVGMRHYDGPSDHRGMHGYDGRRVERRVEVRRMGPGYGPPMGWGYGPPMGGGYGPPMGGGYGYREALPPPPPPMQQGYGYGYGGGVIVTETTVTERPMVERRVWYTTVREKVRVAPRHVVRRCRCKLVKARPLAGERG